MNNKVAKGIGILSILALSLAGLAGCSDINIQTSPAQV